MTIENIVSQGKGAGLSRQKIPADQKSLGEAFGFGLNGPMKLDTQPTSITQKPLV
jgi:hypothetical protein